MTSAKVIGNLTKDVEVKYSEGGVAYAHFTVASDRSKKPESKTDFIRVSAMGDLAESLAGLTKGTFVSVRAYIRTGSHEGRSTTELIATKVAKFERTEQEAAA